jgi:16S rRNA (adenine1518-N6/adenine1519-N6)-dimethyltransferase
MPSRLGQNFLVNRQLARRIVESFLPLDGPVLEIGPGRGILTEPLAEAAAAAGHRLVAVEIDLPLAETLRARLGGTAEIVHADILQSDPSALFAGASCRVIGNIPYLISREIVDWLITHRRFIARGQLLVQREFAAKLLSRPGQGSANAQGAMFQQGFSVRRLFPVNPGSFSPPPRVVSEVVAFTARPWTVENSFYAFLQSAFASRRKTLLNNLQGAYGAAAVRTALGRAGEPETVRAEELAGEALRAIFQQLPPARTAGADRENGNSRPID